MKKYPKGVADLTYEVKGHKGILAPRTWIKSSEGYSVITAIAWCSCGFDTPIGQYQSIHDQLRDHLGLTASSPLLNESF